MRPILMGTHVTSVSHHVLPYVVVPYESHETVQDLLTRYNFFITPIFQHDVEGSDGPMWLRFK
jgi:hypothetical protein